MNTIESFRGDYAFLSNFYESPIAVGIPTAPGELVEVVFPTGEHAFHAGKGLHSPDLSPYDAGKWALVVSQAETPNQAKYFGRRINLDVQSWNTYSIQHMWWVQREKYSQNPHLADLLVATGDATLIEGNTWGDRIWGQVDGVGENILGEILMTLRRELKHSG